MVSHVWSSDTPSYVRPIPDLKMCNHTLAQFSYPNAENLMEPSLNDIMNFEVGGGDLCGGPYFYICDFMPKIHHFLRAATAFIVSPVNKPT